MNRKQREQNRQNAKVLYYGRREYVACPNCGMFERHWISWDDTPNGFWTCPKLYGPDGRRLEAA